MSVNRLQANIIYPLPIKSDYGIGIVGAGGIVRSAHLAAYRKAGLNVVAICDISREAVEKTGRQWGIDNLYTDFRQMLARPDIHIVDIAIPNEGRMEIVKEAASLGKHVLIQKPFAHTYEQAAEMVQVCEAGGIKLAVNQNARYTPFYYATKQIIDSGVLGTPYLLTHEMRINQDAPKAGTWYSKLAHFLIVDYEIHHIDLMRYWSGETPNRVYVSGTKMPGQNFAADMTVLSTLEFASGLRGSLMSVDTTQSDDHFFRFTVEGTEGSLYGRIEKGYKFPVIEYYSKRDPQRWIRPVVRGEWSPDAFYGTMFEMMNAIREDREPAISGKDNLNTLKILHGMIRSAEEKTVITIE